MLCGAALADNPALFCSQVLAADSGDIILWFYIDRPFLTWFYTIRLCFCLQVVAADEHVPQESEGACEAADSASISLDSDCIHQTLLLYQ